MYASLIGAGASQLFDLLKSQTQSTTSSFGVADPSASSTPSTASTGKSAGSSFSTDLNQLFVDLQSGSSTSSATTPATSTSTGATSTDPTTTVANDLQNVFNDLQKAGAGHGHHHHHDTDGDANSASTPTGSTSQTATPSSTSNPFQSLASSLRAYANTQGLTSTQTSSTSLTA